MIVAEATATASGAVAAAEVPVDVQLELLPGAPGDRSLEARLLLPRENPIEGRIERGRLSLSLPDLERELTRLRALWPAWVPALPAGLAAGPLRVDGRLAGRLQDPALRLEGEWTPAPGASLRFSRERFGRGSSPGGPGDPRGAAAGDDSWTARAGTLAGSAELTLSGDRLAGQMFGRGREGSGGRSCSSTGRG